MRKNANYLEAAKSFNEKKFSFIKKNIEECKIPKFRKESPLMKTVEIKTYTINVPRRNIKKKSHTTRNLLIKAISSRRKCPVIINTLPNHVKNKSEFQSKYFTKTWKNEDEEKKFKPHEIKHNSECLHSNVKLTVSDIKRITAKIFVENKLNKNLPLVKMVSKNTMKNSMVLLKDLMKRILSNLDPKKSNAIS